MTRRALLLIAPAVFLRRFWREQPMDTQILQGVRRAALAYRTYLASGSRIELQIAEFLYYKLMRDIEAAGIPVRWRNLHACAAQMDEELLAQMQRRA